MTIKNINKKQFKYFLLGFLWIFIVDFGTFGGLYLSYWKVPITMHIIRVIVFSLSIFIPVILYLNATGAE